MPFQVETIFLYFLMENSFNLKNQIFFLFLRRTPHCFIPLRVKPFSYILLPFFSFHNYCAQCFFRLAIG